MFPIAVLVLLALASSACGGGEEGSSADMDRQLIVAARAGDLDRVRSLLESGAGVEARDAAGATALVAAAYGNHLDVARS